MIDKKKRVFVSDGDGTAAMQGRLEELGYPVVRAGGDPQDPEEAIRLSVLALMDADVIVMVRDWEGTVGGTVQFNLARALGLGVFDEDFRGLRDPASRFRAVHGMYTSETGGQKLNVGKVRMELLPPDAVEEVARVFTAGAEKYEANNWRKGISWAFTLGSVLRHVFALLRCEDRDPETGLLHAAHGAAQLMFLAQFQIEGTGPDDRYRKEVE